MSDNIATLAEMVPLTQPQEDVLLRIVESGATSYVAEGTLQGPMIVKCLGTNVTLEVDPVDWRELEAQDLIKPTTGHGYDLTNVGRMEYNDRKNPPPERRPVGFRPN